MSGTEAQTIIWPKIIIPRKVALYCLAAVLATVGIFIAIAGVADLTLADRYYPKVTVAGVDVGRMSLDQAAETVGAQATRLEQSGLILQAGGETLLIRPDEIGLKIDLTATLQAAWAIGRRPTAIDSLRERALALLGQEKLAAIYQVDEVGLRAKIAELAARFNLPQVDAKLAVAPGAVTITPSHSGRQLGEDESYHLIRAALDRLAANPIQLTTAVIPPAIVEGDLKTARAEAAAAVASPLTLTWNGQSWTLSPEEIAPLLTVTPQENPVRLFAVEVGGLNFSVGQVRELLGGDQVSGKADLNLDLDPTKLTEFISSRLAPTIEQTPVDAKFQYVDGKVQGFATEREGREIDRTSLSTQLVGKLISSGSRELAIPVKVTKPAATLAELNNLGIKELLGRGNSRYTGSTGARVKNITAGSAKINGTLVPPGQVFSMYQAVGDISIAEGFAVGLAIGPNNTTIPAIGGGICHVSSTLFRAVLNAGLPVVERHPHSYRVYYYELDSPPGFDAAVFFPNADFKFKNDTSHYILIQSINDPVKGTLSFEIYGTSDGRQVEVSRPSVYNVVSPGDPIYIDDPTLPVGTTKQTEHAVSGATAVFSRKVTRDGQILLNDTFYSRYIPWKAAYLVGTKEG